MKISLSTVLIVCFIALALQGCSGQKDSPTADGTGTPDAMASNSDSEFSGVKGEDILTLYPGDESTAHGPHEYDDNGTTLKGQRWTVASVGTLEEVHQYYIDNCPEESGGELKDKAASWRFEEEGRLYIVNVTEAEGKVQIEYLELETGNAPAAEGTPTEEGAAAEEAPAAEETPAAE